MAGGRLAADCQFRGSNPRSTLTSYPYVAHSGGPHNGANKGVAMAAPQVKLAFLSGVLVAVTAAMVVALFARQGLVAQGDSDPKPGAAEAVRLPERIGFVDLGRVVAENKARQRDVAEIRQKLEAEFNEFKVSKEKESNTIASNLRTVMLGSPDWRNLQKQRQKLGDEVILKEADLKREEADELGRINKKHFRNAMEVVEATCKARGITVLLNLFNTKAEEAERVNLQAKIFDDNVVWSDSVGRNITDDVIKEMARIDAELNPPKSADSGAPTDGKPGEGKSGEGKPGEGAPSGSTKSGD